MKNIKSTFRQPNGSRPVNIASDDAYTSFFEKTFPMLPDTLLFETAIEPLDEAVVLRRVGGNELLRQPIVQVGGAKAATLKDQPIVAPDLGRRPGGQEGPEGGQTGSFERPLGPLCPPAHGELIADQLAIVTINHRGHGRPAIRLHKHLGHVDTPQAVRDGSGAPHILDTRSSLRLIYR